MASELLQAQPLLGCGRIGEGSYLRRGAGNRRRWSISSQHDDRIDTLENAHELRDAGVPEVQAEAIARQFKRRYEADCE